MTKLWEKVPSTGRKEDIFDDLKLEPQKLEGKRILDIGAGARGLAKYLEENKISAEVISLDPAYANLEKKLKEDEFGRRYLEFETPQNKDRSVAGLGESLPFEDASMDLVISNMTLPAYGTSELQLKRFLEEVTRVTKVEGEVRIFPSRVVDFNNFARIDLSASELDEYWQMLIFEFRQNSQFEVAEEDTIWGQNKLLVIKKLN